MLLFLTCQEVFNMPLYERLPEYIMLIVLIKRFIKRVNFHDKRRKVFTKKNVKCIIGLN